MKRSEKFVQANREAKATWIALALVILFWYAAGFGLEKIEVSPVELTVYDIFPEDHLVVTVVLDKDGRKLTYAGNNTNELAVSGYDISEITVYLYDYDEYMEIKGLALGENSTAFREILEKNALYEKKISIETDKS